MLSNETFRFPMSLRLGARAVFVALILVFIVGPSISKADGTHRYRVDDGKYSYVTNKVNSFVLGYLIDRTHYPNGACAHIQSEHPASHGEWNFGWGQIVPREETCGSSVGRWNNGGGCMYAAIVYKSDQKLSRGSHYTDQNVCESAHILMPADLFRAESYQCDVPPHDCGEFTEEINKAVMLSNTNTYANYDPPSDQFRDVNGTETAGRGSWGYPGVTQAVSGFAARYQSKDNNAVLIKDTSKSPEYNPARNGYTPWGFVSANTIAGERLSNRCPPNCPPPSPPTATTEPATEITQTSATLNGQVDPNGSTTTAWFEYGPTTSYGVRTGDQQVGGGDTPVPFSASIGALCPDTTYNFRAVARNEGGTAYGGNRTFTTLSEPMRVFWRGTDGALLEDLYVPGWSAWSGTRHVVSGWPGSAPRPLYSGDRYYVFWRGSDDALRYVQTDGSGNWGAVHLLTDAGALASGPAAVNGAPQCGAPPNPHVFYRGADDRLWETWWESPGGWQVPRPIVSSEWPGSEPRAIYSGDRYFVFWRGSDDALRYVQTNGAGDWGSVQLLTDAGALASDPSPVSGGTGPHVFYRGADDRLWETWWESPGGWQAPRPIVSSEWPGSEPRAIYSGGLYDVFWRGSDDALRHVQTNGDGQWGSPQMLTGANTLGSDPNPVDGGQGYSPQVFWKSQDGQLWETWWENPGGWQNPQNLGDGPLDSEPHAICATRCPTPPPPPVTSPPPKLHVFWTDTDGEVRQKWYGTSWSGLQNVVSGLGLIGVTPRPLQSVGGTFVFWRGSDDALRYVQNSWGAWGEANLLTGAGALASDPSPVSGGTGPHVFYRGADDRLWETWWENPGGWQVPRPIVSSEWPGSEPRAIYSGDRYFVFWRGSDDALRYVQTNGAGDWGSVQLLTDAGALASDPSPVSGGTGPHVFYRGADDRLWETWWESPGGWQAPRPIVSSEWPGSEPRAIYSGGLYDVFWRGSDDALRHVQTNGDGQWGSPQMLTGANTLGSDPNPVDGGQGYSPQVFWKSQDGQLWETWWENPGGWQNPQNLGDGPLDSEPHAICATRCPTPPPPPPPPVTPTPTTDPDCDPHDNQLATYDFDMDTPITHRDHGMSSLTGEFLACGTAINSTEDTYEDNGSGSQFVRFDIEAPPGVWARGFGTGADTYFTDFYAGNADVNLITWSGSPTSSTIFQPNTQLELRVDTSITSNCPVDATTCYRMQTTGDGVSAHGSVYVTEDSGIYTWTIGELRNDSTSSPIGISKVNSILFCRSVNYPDRGECDNGTSRVPQRNGDVSTPDCNGGVGPEGIYTLTGTNRDSQVTAPSETCVAWYPSKPKPRPWPTRRKPPQRQ